MNPDTAQLKFPLPLGEVVAIYPLPAHQDDVKGIRELPKDDIPPILRDHVSVYEVNLSKMQTGLCAGILLAKGEGAEVTADVNDIVYYPEQAAIDLKGFHYIRDANIIAYDPA